MLKLFRSTSHLGQPWAIEQSAMRAILARAEEQERSFQAIAKEWGEQLEGAWDGQIHDGVAVIPVGGVLMRQLSWWGLFSGSSSYEILIRDINAAVKNPNVRAIILDVDSPGGEVTGCAELADAIHAMAQEKTIVAYGTGMVASAAYWIASSCSRVVVSATSSVGSIGVMATIMDASAAYERSGIKEYRFISSQSPMKNADPGTKEGDAAIQTNVDALAEVFVSAVANFRRVSRADVLSDFGKGGCFVGQAAVDAGLADAVGSLEGLISELGNTNQSTAPALPAVTGGNEMGLIKATAKSLKVKAKARAAEEDQNAEDEEELDAEDEDDVNAEGEDDDTTAEGEDDDTSAEDEEVDAEDEEEAEDEEPVPASKAKAKGEKARIAAILGHPAAVGRRKLAEHIALSTSMSVKAAADMLRASPKKTATSAKGNGFDARLRAQGNVKLGAGSQGTRSARDGGDELLATAKMLGIKTR